MTGLSEVPVNTPLCPDCGSLVPAAARRPCTCSPGLGGRKKPVYALMDRFRSLWKYRFLSGVGWVDLVYCILEDRNKWRRIAKQAQALAEYVDIMAGLDCHTGNEVCRCITCQARDLRRQP